MKMKQKSQSKLVIAMSAVILLLVALSATLTFAYFTSSTNQSDNTLKFDVLELSLSDGAGFTQASGEHALDKLVPGCTVNMNGKVTLTGAKAFLRMKIDITATKADVTMTDTAATNAIAAAIGSVLLAGGETATNKWQQIGNDWYCVVAQEAGDVVDFTGKSFELDKATIGNVWQGATITVKYSFQAVQADHNDLAGADNAAKATSLKTLMDTTIADFSAGI